MFLNGHCLRWGLYKQLIFLLGLTKYIIYRIYQINDIANSSKEKYRIIKNAPSKRKKTFNERIGELALRELRIYRDLGARSETYLCVTITLISQDALVRGVFYNQRYMAIDAKREAGQIDLSRDI